ncbi:MAG: hypothetical protein ABSE57_20175 [Bryobacteraceae bacterium]|jgi:plasmid stability protein
MAKAIQLRNVPDTLHRRLKSKAAREGLSLSDFLLREMEHVAEIPTNGEIMERLAGLPPVKNKRSPAEVIREERESR